ncbi:TonB-dependent receptor [Novosphingobium piscinae]|uniref:TonB-dependent receptor n=1 Tax=Novosphingobium piscinae TaxID=1507448 RepID=A0A7X1FZY1_9SPHN|nr:TonB-dependent receptor [Novosphingobium piscinae]MBC2670100.1 TonB-dependent receptor [Novosphingobium piscinae]
MTKVVMGGMVSALALFAASAAMAQDTNAPPAGEIIVTATRFETLASKTPIALTAVSGDNLRAIGITNPTALADTVPNVSIDRGNGLQITIRGVTSTDGTEKGDPSAAFMLDGIYIARPQVQEVSFFDVQRVEVLRGPQGTLYGRNTTAGLINVLSNKPQLDRVSGYVDVNYGNYNNTQVTGVINVPASENLGFRLATNFDRRDTFVQPGPNLRSDISPFKDNLSFRGSALYKFDAGELNIRADYSAIKGSTVNAVSLSNLYSTVTTNGVNPTYIGGDRSADALFTLNTPTSAPTMRDNKTWGIMADLNYDVGPVTLQYLGSYREFVRREDGLSVRGLGTVAVPTRFDGEYWQQSHELRVATNGTGPLRAQAGAYFFQEQSGIAFYLLGLLNPTVGAPGYVFGFPQNPTKAKSIATFGEATYSLTDTLRLTGGIRYTEDQKSRVGRTVTCSTTACNLATDVVTRNDASRTFKKVTWRAGVDYDLNDRTLVYATVSTGYKAGGFNDGCESGTGTGCSLTADALYYDPETLTSYEIGTKTRIADGVRLNLTAFHYDYTNLQVSQIITCTPGGGQCQATTNAAAAKVDGVEAETTIQASPNDRFEAAVSWLNARYDRYTLPNGANWQGRRLDRSPAWNVLLAYTRTFDLGNSGSIEFNVRSRLSTRYKLAGLANFYQVTQPAFSKTDINVTYNSPDRNWYLQGFVKNLENAITVSSIAPGPNGTAQLADPQLYGVRAGFKF